MSARRMSEIGEESRQRLLDAAEELFLEKGFEATTVVEIGKRAGISHGSIPWHFGNKSGLLYSVVVRLFGESSTPGPLLAGQAGFNRLWHEQTYFDNSPKFSLFGVFFMAELERSPTHRAEIEASHQERRDLLIDWVHRSQQMDSLELKLPVSDLVEFWLGASRGILMQKTTLPDHFDLSAARRGLGTALETLMGCRYFQHLDTHL
jgi:TetR/AcrR family transcriptional regulator, acrAB operon repressor